MGRSAGLPPLRILSRRWTPRHHAAQRIAGECNRAFLDEHETFPAGKFKDQVDAASGAFNELPTASSYDSSYSWWN
jgi:hypothetical protein